jgi:hypothetical protein
MELLTKAPSFYSFDIGCGQWLHLVVEHAYEVSHPGNSQLVLILDCGIHMQANMDLLLRNFDYFVLLLFHFHHIPNYMSNPFLLLGSLCCKSQFRKLLGFRSFRCIGLELVIGLSDGTFSKFEYD